MGFFSSIRKWLGLDTSVRSTEVTMRELLNLARKAKYAENYDQALLVFEQAAHLASNTEDSTALAIINLHRADVLMHQERWQEVEELLNNLKERAERTRQRTQSAYILCSFGNLAQIRNDWDAARSYFEEALQLARDSYTLGAEGRAQGHLADTYLHENNASYAIHLLREALPRLEMSGDVELSSYFVGRLGQAMVASGQEQKGKQVLERALKLAEKMQYRIYIRRWSLALGNLALKELNFDTAYRHYETAIALLPSGQPASAHTVTILSEASKASLHLHDHSTALRYARQAVEMAQELDDKDTQTIAETALAMALCAEGHYAEALPYLDTAEQHYQAGSSDELMPEYIDILRNRALAHAEADEIAEAVATYQRAIDAAAESDQPIAEAHARSGLAVLHRKQGAIQDALDEWNKALHIYEEAHQSLHIARLYCDIAEARRALGQANRAMKDFEQALMMLNSVDDLHTRGVVLSNAANAYVDHGDVETAESFFKESIEIAQKLQDPTAEAIRIGNYGWFLLMTNRINQAIAKLQGALRLSEQLGLEVNIAVQKDNLGTAYLMQNEVDKALQHHNEALEIIEKRKNEPIWEATFKLNKANTLLAKHLLDAASPLFDEAEKTGHHMRSIPLLVRSHIGQAQLSLYNKVFDAAEEKLNEAVTLARQAHERRLLAEALVVQSQQQAAVGRDEEAVTTWEEASKLLRILRAAIPQPKWLNQANASEY